MAYRGITDPFSPKTTRNERFAQMTRQEQLIEQKKREIQAKLEEQKKKQTTEALKKFQSATGSQKTSVGSKVNTSTNLTKSGRKPFWKSDQRWKKDVSEDINSKSSNVNIFNNDGSFLDQFRKLSGVKESKSKRDDDTSGNGSTGSESQKRESDTDWGTWNADAQLSAAERDPSCGNNHEERKQEGEELEKSERLGTAHWFQSHPHQESGGWQGQSNSPPSTAPRPSSPYSPTRATTDPPLTSEKPTALPLMAPMSQFQPASTVPGVQQQPPAMSLTTPPPNMMQRPPVQQFIPYAAPPPMQAMPPSQLPPPSLPPPTMGGVPGGPPPTCPPTLPTTMNVPPPASVMQHTLPPSGVPSNNPLGPQLMPQTLIQQPPIGPPPMLPTLGPPTMTPTMPSSVLVNTAPGIPTGIQTSIPTGMQTGIPPTAIPGTVMTVPHTIPPPCVPLSVPGPAMAGIPTAPGTGAAPVVPVPAEEEATTHLARMVAQCGDDIEEIIKVRNPDDKNLWFLHSKNCTAYIQYRCLVDKFRAEMKKDENEKNTERDDETESKPNLDQKTDVQFNFNGANEYGSANQELKQDGIDSFKREVKKECTDDENSRHSEGKRSGDESDEGAKRRRKRRSRWAPESEKVPLSTPGVAVSASAVMRSQMMLSKVTRRDPALIQYARQSFGTTDLSEEDWQKAEDHYKISLLYQDMMQKRQELERLRKKGRFKYAYDSDEETEGGTWEHKLRMSEMEATQIWAEELTKKAEGKHHIGDFLPPDELERFMEKYSALKAGREPDLSDYKEFKLKEDNIGFQMLQKLGWSEGKGLGTDGAGIVDPVNKATTRAENHGLGLERPQEVSKGDDEYTAYRKRMMLSYRFRPNPLNNPRRAYY